MITINKYLDDILFDFNLYRLSQASTRLGLTEFPWNERTPFANLRRGHTLHSILPPLKEI